MQLAMKSNATDPALGGGQIPSGLWAARRGEQAVLRLNVVSYAGYLRRDVNNLPLPAGKERRRR
jgi:hypothetical protein